LASIGCLVVALGYGYRLAHVHASHHHTPSKMGWWLAFLPVVLGLLVPSRPLGASALGKRELNVGALTSIAPATATVLVHTGAQERNILEWLLLFQQAKDAAAFEGQAARVIGFVYRDDRFGEDTFTVSRFTVNCCVADATAVGLIVRWPEASGLAEDRWVRVTGHFEAGTFHGNNVPILVANDVVPTDPPAHPYLYY
jgi:uncharacterized repeat protein (TIGR03943 family)